jgi:chromosome segregation ATPase
MKHSELLKTYSKLENENEKLENEMKQLTKHQTQELVSIHEQTDQHQISLKDDFETLQLRLNNYENMISQYEEYRVKLETNLHKITQQRDTSRIELRLTKEMFSKKEVDYNQLKLHFDQCEKHLQTQQEQCRQYKSTIQDLQRQGLNQTQLAIIQVYQKTTKDFPSF